eukprot:2945233-Pyramimonas_sp.AAC.1
MLARLANVANEDFSPFNTFAAFLPSSHCGNDRNFTVRSPNARRIRHMFRRVGQHRKLGTTLEGKRLSTVPSLVL